jgi:hypothetical protein
MDAHDERSQGGHQTIPRELAGGGVRQEQSAVIRSVFPVWSTRRHARREAVVRDTVAAEESVKHTETKYHCDKCGKSLETWGNAVVIQTSLHEHSPSWSRLCVVIEHRHGVHNDGTTEHADLCQSCAVAILTDALERVQKGERMSAGVETSKMLGFDQPF